jgi:hypothetical protein
MWSISKDEAVRLCRVYEEEMVRFVKSQLLLPSNAFLGLNVPGS